MRILAIDGATLNMGYGIIECEVDRPIKLDKWGTIKMKGDLPSRLSQLKEKLTELIEEEKPDHVAVEDLKFSKYAPNLSALTKVAYAIGVILQTYDAAGYKDIFSIPANSVRKQWGDRVKKKPDLRAAVNKKFIKDLQQQGRPDGFKKSDEDATDAIGLAVVAWPYFKDQP